MRRLELCLLVSGVMVFAACGSSSSPSKDGGAGKGGSGGASGAGGSSGTSGGSGGSSGTGGVAGGGGTAGGGSGGGGAIGTAGMDGGAGSDAATDAPVDMAPTTDAKTDATDGGGSDALVLTTQEQRGQYLVNVLGCTGCHGTNLAGKSMFAHDTNTNGYLSSANLTNDVSGLKNVSDQAIIDAITQGKDPDAVDGGTQYLFANMPWYQFANLTTADAQAIVAYLRTVPAVSNFPAANTGFFATQPTSPQWTPITLASLPNPVSPTVDGGTDAGTDAGAVPASNGKYLAGLLCVTCHTPDTAATSPLMLDVTRAYQGGRATTVSITVPIDGGADAGDAGDAATTTTVSESIGSANLTPDSTGLGGWTVAQVSTAITAAKDNQNRAICGMRANTALTVQDVTDIVVYLQTIPPVANTPAPTCY